MGWILGDRVHVRWAKSTNGSRTWYTKEWRDGVQTRRYQYLSLSRVVRTKSGSFFKLIVGPLKVSFLGRPHGKDPK